MSETPVRHVRVDPGLFDAARESVGPDAPFSVVVRAALAVLAGIPHSRAMEIAYGYRKFAHLPESDRSA